MRKRLWQLHSWLGLVAGLGLLVIGLSGSLLVFRDELEAWLSPQYLRVTPTEAGRLPLDVLRDAVNRQLPEYELTGWQVRHTEPQWADLIYLIRRGTDEWQVGTLNPYTGTVLATPRDYDATFSGWMLELHSTFLADPFGTAVVGVFGVLLCTLGVSGLWLYRQFWTRVFTLRWGRGARILFSDSHKFVGISSVAFNLLLGFTGAYWNLTHIIDEALHGEHEQPKLERRLYAESVSLDGLVADAAARLPGFRSNFISLPSAPDGGFMLWGAVEPRSPLKSLYGSTVSYDAQTGAFQSLNDLRQGSVWAQIVDSFVPLHYGNFGGWMVKTLWCLAGLAPGLLAVTGFLIWRHRQKALRGTRAAAPREQLV